MRQRSKRYESPEQEGGTENSPPHEGNCHNQDEEAQERAAPERPHRERRGVSVLSRFIDTTLHQHIMPIADRPHNPPPFSTFRFTEQDSLRATLEDIIHRDCPSFCRSKRALLDAMSIAYDEMHEGARR